MKPLFNLFSRLSLSGVIFTPSPREAATWLSRFAPLLVSNILANPLPTAAASISLTARRLPTEAELRSQQVLQLSRVPYFADSTSAFEAFEPVIAPYGEIIDLIRDTNTPHPLAHNGNYQLICKLTDLSKPVPHFISIQYEGKTFAVPVRLDGHANHGGCYFCHSPLHPCRDCNQAPPCRYCQSRGHFWRRCPSRPRLARPSAPAPSTPSTPPSTRLASPPSPGTDRLPTLEPPVAAGGATPTPAPRQIRGRSPSKRPATGSLLSPSLTDLAPPSLIRRIKSVSPNKSSRITRSMAKSAPQAVTSPEVAVVDTEMTEAADDTGPLSNLTETVPLSTLPTSL
ncbi:hypothetical protein V1514DRAFT_128791 [Lipomyces japonicus]|uniref:uncharacterized protein n=1 Tax=Lipomyces japonicus TaxID=56871 RepID=UPI0034CE2C8E